MIKQKQRGTPKRAHHGVGPFVPDEPALGVGPYLPTRPVGRLEHRHLHAALPQPVRRREPTAERQPFHQSSKKTTSPLTRTRHPKPRAELNPRRARAAPHPPDAGADDGDGPPRAGSSEAAMARAGRNRAARADAATAKRVGARAWARRRRGGGGGGEGGGRREHLIWGSWIAMDGDLLVVLCGVRPSDRSRWGRKEGREVDWEWEAWTSRRGGLRSKPTGFARSFDLFF